LLHSKGEAMGESTVFVVRIWRDAPPFRATARPVESDEAMVFYEPAELLRFLVPSAPPLRTPAAGRPSRAVKRNHSKRPAGKE
jgi:hypothetical protein